MGSTCRLPPCVVVCKGSCDVIFQGGVEGASIRVGESGAWGMQRRIGGQGDILAGTIATLASHFNDSSDNVCSDSLPAVDARSQCKYLFAAAIGCAALKLAAQKSGGRYENRRERRF